MLSLDDGLIDRAVAQFKAKTVQSANEWWTGIRNRAALVTPPDCFTSLSTSSLPARAAITRPARRPAFTGRHDAVAFRFGRAGVGEGAAFAATLGAYGAIFLRAGNRALLAAISAALSTMDNPEAFGARDAVVAKRLALSAALAANRRIFACADWTGLRRRAHDGAFDGGATGWRRRTHTRTFLNRDASTENDSCNGHGRSNLGDGKEPHLPPSGKCSTTPIMHGARSRSIFFTMP